MKARYVILAAIIFLLTIPLHVEAQKNKHITLHEGTDSIVEIMITPDVVWIETNDSMVLVRKDIFEARDLCRETETDKNAKYSLEEIQTYSGRITHWHYGDNYKYDGFYLQVGEDTLLVDFHSDLAARIRALNENVEVSIVPKYKGKQYQVVRMLRVHDGKDTLYANMNPIFHKINFNKENAIKGSGTIAQLSKKEKIGYASCLLDNDVLLRFDYIGTKSMFRKLKPGISVEYTGQEDPLRVGEVRAKDYKILHCLTIAINGKEYTVRSDGDWMMEGIKY